MVQSAVIRPIAPQPRRRIRRESQLRHPPAVWCRRGQLVLGSERPAAPSPWRCPVTRAAISPKSTEDSGLIRGEDQCPGRGPVDSRASPFRGRGRCYRCGAEAAIRLLVHRRRGPRLAGPPVTPPLDFTRRSVAGADLQMSRAYPRACTAHSGGAPPSEFSDVAGKGR
jgi:hypothetical protein